MSEEAAFIAALVADPSDRTTALVFADWLDDHDDPRGSMMRIDEVRTWMAPKYENPLPKLRAVLETGKGVTEASKILAFIGEAAVPELVSLLTHQTAIVRLRAVKALRVMGAKAKTAIPALTVMVKDSNQDNARARNEAVRLLGVMRAKQTVTDELAKELDSTDSAERLTAVKTMSKLRTKTAGKSLCKALADESDDVRRAAAEQLRWIAGPTMPFAVEPLRKALSDESALVRNFAAIALGKIGPKAAAAVPDLIARLSITAATERSNLLEAITLLGVGIPEALETILEALRHPMTRQLASNGLLKWPTLPPSAAPAILEFTRDPNSANRYWDTHFIRNGLKLLTRISPMPTEVLEELRAQLAKENASVVAAALAEIGPVAAPLLPDLITAFHSPAKVDKYVIAKVLGKFSEGITTLVQALDREPPDPTLSAAAAAGLKEAGPAARAAIPALLARLRQKPRPSDWLDVVPTLAAIGPEAAGAVPDLIAMVLEEGCLDHQAYHLFAALRAFGPAVLPFAPQLTEALSQHARANRHLRIIELLTQLIPHGCDAFAVLRDVLRRAIAGDFYGGDDYLGQCNRRGVIQTAAAGLAALGPAAEEAIPDLVLADQPIGNDWNREVRQAVLGAYGAIGGAAVPHIRAALDDPLRDVRIAAVKALGETGDASAETQEALRKAETDSNKTVRLRATAALQKMGTRKRKRA
jgi:uncharacterized protein (TIGR02996 family)